MRNSFFSRSYFLLLFTRRNSNSYITFTLHAMGCIVFWQISFYVVLGVFYSMWWCLVTVDAYHDVDEPNSIVSVTNTSVSIPNNTDNKTRNGRPATTRTSNKDEDSLEEQLKDDQMALKRMVTILSLVGFIGALAIVAIIVIFTKMRRRKQRINSKISNTLDNDDDELSTDSQTTTTGTRHRDSSMDHSLSVETPSTQNDVSNINNMSIQSTNISMQRLRLPNTGTIEEDPQPSAPILPNRHQRTLPLMQQSPSPIPSAPTAKELDQQELDNTTDLHPQYNDHSEPTSSVNTTTIVTTPDLPPPAYTPNASPLYDRTYQTAIVTTTANELTPFRRHSQI
jgi:hypothetical protein